MTSHRDKLLGFIRGLRRRCPFDCEGAATHSVIAHCGCVSVLCEEHALLMQQIWAGGDVWHCVDCGNIGVGTPIAAVRPV